MLISCGNKYGRFMNDSNRQYTGFINNSNEPKCDTIQEVNGVYILRAATNVQSVV